MDIFGAIIFMVLPFVVGYSCKCILRWRETNQIETYLIGFFFLFFLQGVILIPAVWAGMHLTDVANIMRIVCLILVVFFLVMTVGQFIRRKKIEADEVVLKTPWKRVERGYFVVMLLVFLLVLLRMFLGMNFLREDIMLETVQTTLQSDALFTTNPLTGRVMEAGMITSKKIVTLPLFYACVVQITGMETEVLLYFVTGAMTLLCSYYALFLLFSKVTTPNRSKQYLLWIVYGLLILSGDYHPGTLAYHLLYRGYDGNTICFSVIMPYLLYLIVSWYKKESTEEKTPRSVRFMYLLKMMLGLAISLVITGIGTGFVFLFMAMVTAGICCLFKSIKEVGTCRES